MDYFLRDLLFGLRMLLKNRGFTLVSVLSLAVGIGVNTTVFSFVNAFLFKSIPVANKEGLVYFFEGNRNNSFQPSSYANYLDYREQGDVFSGLMVYAAPPVLMTAGDRVEELNSEVVSGNYFSVLDVRAAMGRALTPADDEPSSAQPVAVISDELWKRRFNSDPAILGKHLILNGNDFEVVGVAAPNFTGTDPSLSTDVWIPITKWAGMIQRASRSEQVAETTPTPGNANAAAKPGAQPAQKPEAAKTEQQTDRLNREHNWLSVIGRLKPGVEIGQAQAAMTAVARRVQQSYGTPDEGLKVTLSPISEMHPIAQGTGIPAALFVMAVTSLILVICCVNVASLMLARAAVRQKEFAIRLALGSSRRRLIQQLLTESLLLSIIGGLLGLLLTYWTTHILLTFLPPGEVAFASNIEIDKTVLGFSLLISLLTGIVFGLVPALHASKPDLLRSLKEELVTVGGTSKINLRRVLVVVQIVVSMVLLISAGLFVRSFRNGEALSRDYTSDKILLLSLNPKQYGYSLKYGKEFYRQLMERIENTPGVQSVTLSHVLPLSIDQDVTRVIIEGQTEARSINHSVIAANYFETLNTPLVRGRDFTVRDDESAPKVVIINETMARTFWQGEDAIGKRLYFGRPDKPFEVVGIAKDSRYNSFGQAPEPYVYVPVYQRMKDDQTLILRTSGEPRLMIPVLQREIRDMGGDLPIFDFRTLDDISKLQLIPVQAAATLLGALGVIGLVVATIGIYGVTSFTFNQRRHEIGIRMALGAQRSDVLMLVIREGLGLALIGIVIGVVVALGITQFMSRFLYGISALDPFTFLAVSVILVSVALIASFIPARKAANVNPMDAIRYE